MEQLSDLTSEFFFNRKVSWCIKACTVFSLKTGDKSAETAIKKAIEEINSKIIADGVASQDINDNQNVGEKDTNENMNAAEQQGGQTEEQTADTSKEDNSKTGKQ